MSVEEIDRLILNFKGNAKDIEQWNLENKDAWKMTCSTFFKDFLYISYLRQCMSLAQERLRPVRMVGATRAFSGEKKNTP